MSHDMPAVCTRRGPRSFRTHSNIRAVFSFLYLKKIKNLKIYVHFEKFQKYTPVTLWGATGVKCNFFFFKFAKKSLEKKKREACRPLGGDRLPLPYFNPWPLFAAIPFVI